MALNYRSGEEIQEGDLVRYAGPYSCNEFGLVKDASDKFGNKRVIVNFGQNISENIVWRGWLEFICRNGKKRMSWL